MATRVVVSLAVMFAVAAPVSSAFAQFDHALRMATDVATRRAQVRAALCTQQRPAMTTQDSTQAGRPAMRLPTSPPVGTAGPVPTPACPSR